MAEDAADNLTGLRHILLAALQPAYRNYCGLTTILVASIKRQLG
jgi:hypothetical protein